MRLRPTITAEYERWATRRSSINFPSSTRKAFSSISQDPDVATVSYGLVETRTWTVMYDNIRSKRFRSVDWENIESCSTRLVDGSSSGSGVKWTWIEREVNIRIERTFLSRGNFVWKQSIVCDLEFPEILKIPVFVRFWKSIRKSFHVVNFYGKSKKIKKIKI